MCRSPHKSTGPAPRGVWGRCLLLASLCCVAGPLYAVDAVGSGEAIDWAQARQFWAFQSPEAQSLPHVRDAQWPRQRIDYFILARLEEASLAPAPEADRRTLIRRLAYTLTGLPPTPDQVEVFVNDSRVDAYEQLVERTLASPAYGERLASLWLTLARYAEDQAHQVGDDTKHFYPNAHLYRNWVVRAFNRDLPYDEFIRRQIAADIIVGQDTNELPALGFIGLGPKYYNRGRLEVKADEWEDRVDTVSRTFLGLTVACARCHQHKYDPITMEDYYAMAGVFAGTEMVNQSLLPPAASEESDVGDGQEGGEDKKAKKKKEPDNAHAMHIVREGEPTTLHVFLRGNVESEGPEAPRRFLQVLCQGEPEPFTEGSGRHELAEAIADPDNPLTARVMVNRLWGLVFARPLVATPSNFGRLGEPPTHPRLLDDLAVRFMAGGWSVKQLAREMVLSATFRQSSFVETTARQADPANTLLSHMNRRRMTVEMFRDAMLFVTDELRHEEGPSLELDDPANLRRTLYGRVSRLELNDLLMQFDYPDANVHNPKRATTITPMQKLFVLNSPFMQDRARALARRAEPHGETEADRIQWLYQSLYGRPASPAELQLGLSFLGSSADGTSMDDAFTVWDRYAQALLAANEMSYVD